MLDSYYLEEVMSNMITNSPRLINETLVPLEKANDHFPDERSRQSYERWMRFGCRGVILESVTIGSRRYLSVEGIARFLSGQAGAKIGEEQPPCIRRPHNGAGRMTEQEITAKSREHGLPE
jgi:hypothetical protein